MPSSAPGGAEPGFESALEGSIEQGAILFGICEVAAVQHRSSRFIHNPNMAFG